MLPSIVFIGTYEGKEEFILEKCKEWTEEIEGLASIALHEPQLAYCAFTLGSSCRWSFLMRTTPNISQLLGPIKEKITHTLIPNITGRMLQSDDERALFALPARLGGVAFTNPVEVADTEYSHSLLANIHLADSILRQHVTYISNHENIKATSNAISHANNTKYEKIQAHLKASLPPCISKMIIFTSEKGASSWLTGRPLESSGHVLNKQFFQDAICLRYNFTIPNRAATCICGEPNTVDHKLICKRGPFANCRHYYRVYKPLNQLSCFFIIIYPIHVTCIVHPRRLFI